MSRKIDLIIDECIAALEAGMPLEKCLRRYPEEAETLRPLLEMWMALQEVPPAPAPHPAAIAHGRVRVMEAVERRAARRLRRGAGTLITMPRWATAMVMAIIVCLGMVGTTVASASAIPGDPLYPVKTTVEQIRLLLTLSPDARTELASELQTERLEEVAAVLDERRIVEVHFWGQLSHWSAEAWTIAGYTVRLDANTIVEGDPEEGAQVEVWARAEADGTLVGLRLYVQPPLKTASLSPLPTVSQPGRPNPPKTPTPHVGTARQTPHPSPSPTHTPTRNPTPTPTSTAAFPTATPTAHHAEPTPTEGYGDHTAPTSTPGTPMPTPTSHSDGGDHRTPTPYPTGTPTGMPPTPTPTETKDHEGGGHHP